MALHPEGMEAVFGEDGTNRLSLAVDSTVLAPTSSGYHLLNPVATPGCWWWSARAGGQTQGTRSPNSAQS